MKKWHIILGSIIVLLIAWAAFFSSSSEPGGPEVPSAMIPPPIVVPLVQSNMPMRVFQGGGGILMILPDGSLWRWGQIGPGNWPRARVPAQVGTNHDWMEACTANNHSVALRANGTMWKWGWRGKSGVGGRVRFSGDPEQVDNGTDWIGISAGDVHSVALKRDGTLWAWGDNGKFQLGNGAGPSQIKPVQIGTNHDWMAISGMSSYTLGLRKDGTLWVWGGGYWVGANKGVTNFPFPTQICRDTNWVGVAMQWALLRHQTLELWNPLFSPPNPKAPASSICRLMASNWILNRSALGFGAGQFLYEVRTNGTLWRSRITYNSGVPTPSNKWRQVGKRSDWVSIWGFGTVVGLNSDGTLWTWGGDPGQDPVPDFQSKITLLKVRLMRWIGKPMSGYSTAAFEPYQKEPRPLMRLAPVNNATSNSERIPAR